MKKIIYTIQNLFIESKIQITLILVLSLFLVIGRMLYAIFGHQLIRAIYEGKTIVILNKVIKLQINHPLNYYFIKIDELITFYTLITIIFLTCLLGFSLFIKDVIIKKYFFIYLILGTLLFFVRLGKVIQHYNIFDNVFYGTSLAPNLYRVLVPYFAFLLRKIAPLLSWLNSARIWNFVFILSTLPLFHIYLSKWFEKNICFLITFILVCLLPISFWFDYPEDFLELGTFIIGYILIRDKKDFFLYPLVLFATLNRETTVFLVVSYFISNISKKEFLKVSIKSSILFIFWLIPFIGLRIIRGIKSYRSPFFTLDSNILSISKAFLLLDFRFFDLLFFLFIFILIYIIFSQEKSGNFLKRNLITSAIFFIVGLNTALISEIRIFYPILPILIPLGFYPLFGKK